MSFIGLDKVGKLFQIVRANGGIRKSLRKLYMQDELKIGTLVGSDKYGNKYFENNEYFYGRNRWVDYNHKHNLEYDGSMVPAEWFGWLHYKTDTPPTVKGPVNYKWISDHTENKSGTPDQYVPFTTTKPKIESWVPPKK
ncbi:putative NADH dehydrogenase [ubiquinone] 1 alpha subcomplex subunit 12 [Orchesella cincta]|uniref:NADH dehydrogenase [ubiquinone] 1 alpha subcomplex subunit 12 n=1 Tax=Orchesella cincta TaxID=48709 RepID=A0A1D2NF79_ORCCI|nr:putative NADH dehydrogenase [ubiquinone] 1 alpha subcomplex subunit 12 [Orchesella cincta]